MFVGVRPVSEGLAELEEGREGPEEEGAMGTELGGNDDLDAVDGGGLIARCAGPPFVVVVGSGPLEDGRCGEVVGLGGGGGRIGLVLGELAGGLVVFVFVFVAAFTLVFGLTADPEPIGL